MRSFASDDEVRLVVERFERCEFALAEFDHSHHLAVGMSYLWDSDFDEAMERMRACLRGFSGHHGKMGYHETITRFWLLRLVDIKRSMPAGATLNEAVRVAVGELSNQDLIFQHYSRERLMSEEAKRTWLAADR